MLIIFYCIVSSFWIHVLEIDGFSVNKKNELLDENETNSEIVTNSGSVLSKHKSLLKVIENPREAPNLKLNIFDKMLSNEILSIKQQLYDNNETNKPSFYMTFKNSVVTPTLELKQRWPIEKVSSQPDNEHKKANTNKTNTTNDKKDLYIPNLVETNKESENKLNETIQSKVLGVRSFDLMPAHNSKSSNNHQCTKRQCTCMRTNPLTSCSYRCSQHIMKTCTQTESYISVDPQCTRNVMPFQYFPYPYYSTLFVGVTTDSSMVYYHPDVINELKLPKHKHSRIKKPIVGNVYDESDDSEYDGNKYLANENLDEDIPEKMKYPNYKDKTERPDKVKKVYFTHFTDSNKKYRKSEADNLSDSYFEVVDKEKFVEDVVNDLKVYYSDAVIKDCYCSLSSFKFRTENLIIYFPMLITLII